MISKKTIYGLEAVILLAKHSSATPVLINDLAKEGRIPKKFLEAILLELKKNGILDSKKGKGGGYVLAKMPKDISVGEIILTLEGPSSEIFFEDEGREIDEIKMIIKEVRNAVSDILDKTTLADILERAQRAHHVSNFVI